jgi:hypothetical protein
MSDKAEAARAFVTGASLYACAVAYWAQRDEYTPSGLCEFINGRIREYCGSARHHGYAGMDWADHDPLWVSLAETIREAAHHAGLKLPKRRLETALERHGLKPDTLLCYAHGKAGEVATAVFQPQAN